MLLPAGNITVSGELIGDSVRVVPSPLGGSRPRSFRDGMKIPINLIRAVRNLLDLVITEP